MSRKNNLQKATEEWKQLERKTEEQRKEAENYYASNLMGLIEEAFIKITVTKSTRMWNILLCQSAHPMNPWY